MMYKTFSCFGAAVSLLGTVILGVCSCRGDRGTELRSGAMVARVVKSWSCIQYLYGVVESTGDWGLRMSCVCGARLCWNGMDVREDDCDEK